MDQPQRVSKPRLGTEDMEVPGPYCVNYVPGPVTPSCSLIEEMPCAQNLPLFLKYLPPLQRGAHSKHIVYYVTINFDHGWLAHRWIPDTTWAYLLPLWRTFYWEIQKIGSEKSSSISDGVLGCKNVLSSDELAWIPTLSDAWGLWGRPVPFY